MTHNQKYFWTEAKDDIIRKAWGVPRVRLTDSITEAARRIEYPRHIVRLRAGRLGLTNDLRRPWTEAEIAILEKYEGQKSTKTIARILGREWNSVASMMDRKKISRRVSDGYSRRDIELLLGVSDVSVAKWIKRGYLKVSAHNRIWEHTLRDFIQNHPEEYNLKRVDELLFKAMIFSTAKTYWPGTYLQTNEAAKPHPLQQHGLSVLPVSQTFVEPAAHFAKMISMTQHGQSSPRMNRQR